MLRKNSIMITLALAVLLVFGISANAFAEEPNSPEFIVVGEKTLWSGQYMTGDGDISYKEPSIGYVYYDKGKITLQNFVFTYDGSRIIYNYNSGVMLELIGRNSLTSTEPAVAISINGDFKITGDGTLDIHMKEDSEGAIGLLVVGDLTFENATLNIDCPGDESLGLKTGYMTMNSGSIITRAADGGIHASDTITVNGGFIKAEGQNGAISAPLSEVAAGIPIKAGDSWDALTEYTSLSDAGNAKCVEIGTEPKPEPEPEPDSDIPKTADTHHALPYGGAAIASILLLGVVIRKIRRER